VKKTKISSIGIAIIIVLMIAAMATPAYALANPITITWSGKGAVAEWNIPDNTQTGTRAHPGNSAIYAVLNETNSGTDAKLYVRVTHFESQSVPRVSEANSTVHFEWNMTKITVTATDMVFNNVDTTNGFAGKHTIVIEWQALPKSQGNAPATAPAGMTINLDGTWKAANAGIFIDGNTGAHGNNGNAFLSDAAYIVHGDLIVTVP
jgi:hypothetical protein